MVGYFNFKKFKTGYLITNDFGSYAFVTNEQFLSLVKGTYEKGEDNYEELRQKFFIFDRETDIFGEQYIDYLRRMKGYLLAGTSLHIFVVTNACNMNCVYCQAKGTESNECHYMSRETGEKAIDMALQSPTNELVFEFQGGEPLLNFDTIKAMILHCEEVRGDKNVRYTLVSNLIALTEEKLEFLEQYHVDVSTSMDGPKFIHDHNRKAKGGFSSFDCMQRGLKKLQGRGISSGAIETTTRFSLKYPEEIVRAYYEQGLHGIFLRPLTPLGVAAKDWDKIGYEPEEFLGFYKKALNCILEINRNGSVFSEFYATHILRKMLAGVSENYMELRSPCGACVGQLAYNYDGNVYTCDEGRMIAEAGDKAFLLGNVYEHTYNDLMNSSVCRAVSVSSVTESIPACSDCVYNPYCGVCPVVTYASERDLFPKSPDGFKCRINKGIMDILIDELYNGNTYQVFCSWL